MDAKDLRTEPVLSERTSDASKYAQSGTSLQCNRNKSYQDIGSNPSAKVDTANARPCAVIGPDRVVPSTKPNDAYLKKAPLEPWSCPDTVYHRPPEYPHKVSTYHNPTRNISPRQTFQENMQRIMVPPTYNSVKANEDAGFIQKVNVTSDAKYCDVPYSVSNTINDPKNIRSVEMCLPNVNSALGRPPHGWPPSGINIRPQRPYVSSDMYQFPEYASCAGPRPISVSRPHRTISEESGYMYPEHYYTEPNIRFKPYPNVKERYPQPRYDYVNNYSNPFHPSPCPPQKYEIPKSLPVHPYPGYPHFKYIDSRMPEAMLEGYQRSIGQQGNYNVPHRNQMHPQYGPMMSNNSQSKIPPYPPDGALKAATSNKLPYENGKIYLEYDNTRTKPFPPPEGFYPNEMTRHHAIPKGIGPNYAPINVHSVPPHSYYKKDNPQIKNYEYVNHYKNFNHTVNMNSPTQRFTSQFSPNAIAISPTDTNTSNDTLQTHGTTHEDCGYASQSSTTSVRSIDLGNSRIPNDYYTRYYDPRFGPIIRTAPPLSKTNRNNNSSSSDNKDKKDMDVRKFLQMWNEGDDDNTENSSGKEIIVQNNSNDLNNTSKTHGVMNNQEQLYVLGLVNVPSEELGKYEHIQKVSKLPENIKGYNSIELLNQFEEVIESSNINGYKLPVPKEFHAPAKQCAPRHSIGTLPRPISPLDVEAKISQSVIHKEVGCNFEIKPCSPKMLNVEIAAPVQNILNERVIEKVTNPLSMISSPMLNGIENIERRKIPDTRQDQLILDDSKEISSCNMINTQFSNPIPNSIKTNYSIQDLESNAGVCLASLPRLDNDIELNFPEVNQQFINANKGEPVIKTHLKDLPEFHEIDQAGQILNGSKTENVVRNVVSPRVETEREFTKLSKYRKTKTNNVEARADKLAVKVIRTDSVIIKNPENAKASESSKDEYVISKINQPFSDELSLEENFVANTIPNINMVTETKPTKLNSPEIAIDFRLPKIPVQNIEITQNVKNCESVQFSREEEILDESRELYENKEVTQCSNIDKEGILGKEINDISSTNKHTESDIAINEIARTPNIESFVIGSNTEYSNVSDIVNKIDTSSDSPHSLESNIKCQSDISETQIEIENTILGEALNKNDIETSSELQEKNIVSNLNDMEFKNDTCDILVANESYDKCKVIKPTEGIKLLGSVEPPETEKALCESDRTKNDINEDIIQSEFPLQTSPIKNEKQKNSSNYQEIKNSTDIPTTDDLSQKEDKILNDVNMETCEPYQHTKTTEMSKFSADLECINEIQNCSEETDCSGDINNEIKFENIQNDAQKDIESMRNVNKCYGYGSKELYSPWIQKLIMYDEGVCCTWLASTECETSVEIDSLDLVSELPDLENDTCSEKLNDPITSKSPASESMDNSIINDETLLSMEVPHIETNTLLNAVYNEQLNLENTNEDKIVISQENLSYNIRSDETLNNNDKNVKCENFIEELHENICDNGVSENVPGKIDQIDFELGATEQTKDTQDENIIAKDGSKSIMDSSIIKQISKKNRMSLKRSLSDSALNIFNNDLQSERHEISVVWPFKRSKIVNTENVNESEIIAQNLCNILQHNRRNSISAVYNEDVSFCILIEDNTILNEENDDTDKICYAELSEDCLNEIDNTYTCEENNVDVTSESITGEEEINCEYSENITENDNRDVALDETWVEDIACMETVVSDDIAEDIVISSASTPKENDFWENEESSNYLNCGKEPDALTDGLKFEDVVHYSEPEILKLCESTQIDEDRSLLLRESNNCEMFNGLYDNELLEKILSGTNSRGDSPCDNTECVISSGSPKYTVTSDNKKNTTLDILSELNFKEKCFIDINEVENNIKAEHSSSETYKKMQDVIVHSCESSIDNVFSYNQKDSNSNYAISSSPEVSSTTSEEKNSSLLLKITNYKGTKISQINSFNINNNNKISCKFTEKTDYVNQNTKLSSKRPLLTKAAQKYIPPIKETFRDLKVKLSLPQHSLLKLKQIKTSKDEPKLNKQSSVPSKLPKKPKPNFEDVLKSIDEIQFKMHKEKNKKVKKSIPKVVIKKSENGSHYASTSHKDTFNPDLTGRKWQPWVFIEKNNFIDKMAMRRKTKAIFSHRKNAFVLIEKFHKYKSASSTKFIISQPKLSDSSTGQLKYTIRLKHNY